MSGSEKFVETLTDPSHRQHQGVDNGYT